MPLLLQEKINILQRFVRLHVMSKGMEIMRTREEQIAELAKRFAWPSIRLEEGHTQDATGVIIEAERRAEQRVRAEIGRDSERLDWLAAQFKTTTVYMSGDAIYAPSRLLFSLKGRGFRDAIDTAREVG